MILNPGPLFPREDRNIYWLYNVNQEQSWNDSKVFPSITDLQQLKLVWQQEQQLLFIANPQDIVLFHDPPDNDFLSYLQNFGLCLPGFQYVTSKFPNIESKALVIPYIVTKDLYDWSTDIGTDLFGSDHDLVKEINNKFLTRRLAEANGFKVTRGFFCNNQEDLRQSYKILRREGFAKCVLKIPYGSSGKGLKIIDNEQSFETLIKFISRRNQEFDLLLEGWYPVRQNINAQLWIDEYNIKILAITEQQIDEYGIYMGTNFTPEYDQDILVQYNAEIMRLGRILQDRGYRGICGIDSIIDEQGILFPIIEINARFTQVTYILPLVEKLINKSAFIITRFIRFETKEALSIDVLLSYLQKKLKPDEANHFMIYTYAFFRLPNQFKTMFRIYVMFYGNNKEKLTRMSRIFSTLPRSINS